MLGENFSVFKVIGIFVTTIFLIIFFSSAFIGVVKGIKNNDYKMILTSSGGKLFSIDYSLQQETNILLNQSQIATQGEGDGFYNQSSIVIHLVYCLTLIFILFTIGYLLFRIGNWLSGQQQFNPSTDVMIFLLLFTLFFVLEFLYTRLVIKENMIPIYDGVIYFFRSLPQILTSMV